MYQAVDKGPIFYSQEGSDIAGQWKKPAIYRDGDDDEDNHHHTGKCNRCFVYLDDALLVLIIFFLILIFFAGAHGNPPTDPEEVVNNKSPSANSDPPMEHPPVAADTQQVFSPLSTSKRQVSGSLVVPELPLEPIVAQQAPLAARTNTNIENIDHLDSQDPGLYELSGVTLDSKQNKVSLSSSEFTSLFKPHET